MTIIHKLERNVVNRNLHSGRQIRTRAGEGEHMFASGRLVVWSNKESVFYQGQRVESLPILENLYFMSDSVVRIRISEESCTILYILDVFENFRSRPESETRS